MSDEKLYILILEDRPEDVELMVRELRRSGLDFEYLNVASESDYLAALDEEPDVILSDYSLGSFRAPDALRMLQGQDLDIPFIVVTGSISEEVAVECMRQGASDYLLKDRLMRLPQAVQQALRERELRHAKFRGEIMRIELEKERELLALKERFVSMVSHEFRTPLTIIGTSSQMLRTYSDRMTDARRELCFHQIESQVSYMVELLDDLLLYGKVNTGKTAFAPQPLDLVALCQDIFETLQMTDPNGHVFVFESTGDFTAASMDDKLLRHILVNLLSNAMKYTPKGKTVRFSVQRGGDNAVFTITDEGIGIPPADLKRLFEPFHRAHNAKGYEGTGLGLAIVKSNVEIHGGTIHCESSEGVGTTFTVSLPLSTTPISMSEDQI